MLLGNTLWEIVKENDIDIIVLQEAYGRFINSILDLEYDEIPYPGNGQGSGVRVFLKNKIFDHFSIQRAENNKLVFVHLRKVSGTEEFNIAAVHLHSKVGNTERQQLWKNAPILEKIHKFEKVRRITRIR